MRCEIQVTKGLDAAVFDVDDVAPKVEIAAELLKLRVLNPTQFRTIVGRDRYKIINNCAVVKKQICDGNMLNGLKYPKLVRAAGLPLPLLPEQKDRDRACSARFAGREKIP